MKNVLFLKFHYKWEESIIKLSKLSRLSNKDNIRLHAFGKATRTFTVYEIYQLYRILINFFLKRFVFTVKRGGSKAKQKWGSLRKARFSSLFCEVLDNLPLLLPSNRTMRHPVVIVSYRDIFSIGRFGIKWKHNSSVAQSDVISPLEKSVYLLPNPKEDTVKLGTKRLGSSDLSTIVFCLIIKWFHYLKAPEGGTEFCWTDTQDTWHKAHIWGRESVTGRLVSELRNRIYFLYLNFQNHVHIALSQRAVHHYSSCQDKVWSKHMDQIVNRLTCYKA